MTFEFLTDAIPFGYTFNFDNYLFNKSRHLATQGIPQRIDFFIVNRFKKRIEAKIHFLIKKESAHSPFRSLFGSFEFNPSLSTTLLGDFVSHIFEEFRRRSIRNIFITHPAECYSMIKSEKVNKVLVDRGFDVVLKAVNHHIPVTQKALLDLVHPMERRKIAKCKKIGLEFKLENHQAVDDIFNFITNCRREKDLEPSIGIDQLKQYLKEFPQEYFLFTVKDRQALYAATVGIRASKKVLYNFLPASPEKYNSLSPSALLYDGLHNFCQQHKYETLDLGISTTEDGKNQDGLIAFKEHMAGQPTFKYSYHKSL